MLETLLQWLVAILAIALGVAIGLVLFVGGGVLLGVLLVRILAWRNRPKEGQ